MQVALKIWRYDPIAGERALKEYEASAPEEATLLDVLDIVKDQVDGSLAYRKSCRMMICGSCGMRMDGAAVLACKTRMYDVAQEGHVPVISAMGNLPVVKDLVVDRSAFDRIIAAGGYVSVNVGGAPDGNAIPIPKDIAEVSMDSAACIGCGACVAACKNASAHLFMAAKISQLSLLPQGQPERHRRVLSMIAQADAEGFGSCSNEGECEAVCPKEISISNIARMNRDFLKAIVS